MLPAITEYPPAIGDPPILENLSAIALYRESAVKRKRKNNNSVSDENLSQIIRAEHSVIEFVS
jgi:hypothetical protein